MEEQYAVVEQELNYQLASLVVQEVVVEIGVAHRSVVVEDGLLHGGEDLFTLQIVVMSVVKLATMPETVEIKEDVLGADHVPDLQDEGGHTHHQDQDHVQGIGPVQGIDLVPDRGPDPPVEIGVDHMTVDHVQDQLREIGIDHPLVQYQEIEIRLAIILDSYIMLKDHM